jgi:sugar-specific transcriptional regulator TrmB
MEEKEILKKLGLEKHEIATYLGLLGMGPANISEIANKTGVYRPILYKILPEMEMKGLVAKAPKGKRIRYTAEPPSKLKNLIDSTVDQLEEILPDLTETYRLKNKKPIVRFFEGKSGIALAFYDFITTVKKEDTYYRYSSDKDPAIHGPNSKYLPKNYKALGKGKWLQGYVISNTIVAKAQKELNKKIKVVPLEYDRFEYNVTQMIYDNKVSFIDYNSEMALIIENPTMATFQKSIFKLLFDRLPNSLD